MLKKKEKKKKHSYKVTLWIVLLQMDVIIGGGSSV